MEQLTGIRRKGTYRRGQRRSQLAEEPALTSAAPGDHTELQHGARNTEWVGDENAPRYVPMSRWYRAVFTLHILGG